MYFISVPLIFIVIGLLLASYLKQKYTYWKIRAVPTLPWMHFLRNMLAVKFHKKSHNQVITEAYKHFEGHPYFGFYNYTEPAIVLRDPDLIGKVLITDFAHFAHNAFDKISPIDDPIMGYHPVFARDEKWKEFRGHITPCFSVTRIKNLTPVMLRDANKLQQFLVHSNVREIVIDAKELAYKITAENVASCAFGLDGQSFHSGDQEGDFVQIGRELFKRRPFFQKGFLSKQSINSIKDIFQQCVKIRESNSNFNGQGQDFLSILLSYQKNKQTVNMDHVLGHVGCVFPDCIETVSTVISHALYELALNQEAQQKLRQEITHCHQLNYETIKQMAYLDQVVRETLRMHPPVLLMTKRVTKPYCLPNSEIELEVGTRIIIPREGLHTDERYFPQAHLFQPERFAKGAGPLRNHTFLPFSEGPRTCVGKVLGTMQTKVALIAVISQFSVELSPKCVLPPQVNLFIFTNNPRDGYLLQLTQI